MVSKSGSNYDAYAMPIMSKFIRAASLSRLAATVIGSHPNLSPKVLLALRSGTAMRRRSLKILCHCFFHIRLIQAKNGYNFLKMFEFLRLA